MTSVVREPAVNWTRVEAGLGALAFGLVLLAIGWPNTILTVFAGLLSVLGSGYLFSLPSVRLYLKIAVNRASRKQVFKNTGTISGNVVGPIDTGGGPLSISQNAGGQKIPFVRAVPVLNYIPLGPEQYLEFAVDVTNIGDGIATNIRGQSKMEGPQPLALPNGGAFQVHPLGPGETKRVRIVAENAVKLTRLSYNVKIQYCDLNGKDGNPAATDGLIKDLKLENFWQGLGLEKR